MKWDFDGIAITPKFCHECRRNFMFERYKKYVQTRIPNCYGYDYVCHKCYSKSKVKEAPFDFNPCD